MKTNKWALGLAAVLAVFSATDSHAQLVRSAAGTGAADIAPSVSQFQVDLSAPNNGNAPGQQPAGRREISWDGGGAAAPAATFGTPMTTFNSGMATRGAVFTTPGTGFKISGQPSPEFGEINPTYPSTFNTFSSPRLFTAIGSNIVDVLFFVAGSDTPALVQGFGAVFTDVDLANTTSIQFFDASNASLGTFFVPNVAGANETLSFLGVSFADDIVSRVRVMAGNTQLGANDGGAVDVVALDDFLYSEPVAALAVPEPSTLALCLLSLLILTAFVQPGAQRVSGGRRVA